MKSGGIRINKLAVRLRGIGATEARGRGASIAREVARAVARQAAQGPGTRKHIDRLTLGTASAFEPQIERQWMEK